MRQRFTRMRQRFEAGQAMILFAVLLPAMVGVMGMAIEGGRVWVEYKRMQAAADMAALVGAQTLPCALTNTTCQANARDLACTYAANNGFANTNANCKAGTDAVGSGKSTAANGFVPPQACAPYDFLDYGNDGVGGCKSKANGGVGFYDYIEVQLKDNLGTIPIFNIPVELNTRAIARHGAPSSADYAVNLLSTSASCGYDERGASGTYFVTGVTFSNQPLCRNSGLLDGCDGGFKTASTGGNSSILESYAGASTQYAPPSCDVYSAAQAKWVPATADSTPNFQQGQPILKDPFCDSLTPPFSGVAGTGYTDKTCSTTKTGTATKMANCPDCNAAGFWYDSSWHQGGDVSASGNVELFPGVYGNLSFANKSMVYFNPGVYSFTGIDVKHSAFCVYGAPTCDNSFCTASACDSGDCGSTSFGLRTPLPITAQKGDLWYRNCSPYGKWDATLSRTGAAANTSIDCTNKAAGNVGPCLDAPKFLIRDPTTGVETVSTKPLNGVTIYIPSTGSPPSGSGKGASADANLAAPNPCAGNGTSGAGNDGYFAEASPGVQWPDGTSSSSATITYPSGSYAQSHGATTASGATDGIYPNADWTLLGECYPNNYEVWPGEMRKGQHLHFLFFTRASGSFDFGGNLTGTFTGLDYAPNADMLFHGNAGGTGPPFVYGQIVASTMTVKGNDTVTVVYRPCNEKEDACASGLGTQLIQ